MKVPPQVTVQLIKFVDGKPFEARLTVTDHAQRTFDDPCIATYTVSDEHIERYGEGDGVRRDHIGLCGLAWDYIKDTVPHLDLDGVSSAPEG